MDPASAGASFSRRNATKQYFPSTDPPLDDYGLKRALNGCMGVSSWPESYLVSHDGLLNQIISYPRKVLQEYASAVYMVLS
jgi:hypothetical protein